MSTHLVIISLERSRTRIVYWKANECGYTEQLREAERYPILDAARIMRKARGGDIAINEWDAERYEALIADTLRKPLDAPGML